MKKRNHETPSAQHNNETTSKGETLLRRAGVTAIGTVAAATVLLGAGGHEAAHTEAPNATVTVDNDDIQNVAHYVMGGRGGGDGKYMQHSLKAVPGGPGRAITHPGGMGLMPGEAPHGYTIQVGVDKLKRATGSTPEKDVVYAHSQGTMIAGKKIRQSGTNGDEYHLHGSPGMPDSRLVDDPLYGLVHPLAKGFFGIDADTSVDKPGVVYVGHKDDMTRGLTLDSVAGTLAKPAGNDPHQPWGPEQRKGHAVEVTHNPGGSTSVVVKDYAGKTMKRTDGRNIQHGTTAAVTQIAHNLGDKKFKPTKQLDDTLGQISAATAPGNVLKALGITPSQKAKTPKHRK